jgi:AcrR family transcriptional regulator
MNRSDGLETRSKLLAAAGSVFAARGYHDAKTADICRMADANIAAVHYHFRSKEQLYVEAWRNAFEQSIRTYPPDGGIPESAPAEDRLRGQIHALAHRIMDPDSIDFDIAHKEMANPTGLLSEVMRRSIDPLRQRFTNTVRDLLGKQASDKQVHLCAMSVHAQCFTPLIHERHRKAAIANGKPSGPPPMEIEADPLADHIFRFSLAGIEAARNQAGRPKRRDSTMTRRGKN